MASILDSSATGRVEACRNALVLDLATRHGPFWQAIDAVRQRWGVQAVERLPPELPAEIIYIPWEGTHYFPDAWPTRLPPSPLAGISPEADALLDPPACDEDLDCEVPAVGAAFFQDETAQAFLRLLASRGPEAAEIARSLVG